MMTGAANSLLISLSDPDPPAPPDSTIDCPVGYEFFNFNFSEYNSRDYITEITDFCSLTAVATPFLRKGYTPMPPGRKKPHNPWGGAGRVLRTSMRDCKADPDLCTPNTDFGGDGQGFGGGIGMPGANEYFQGNAIIIQERDKRNADDSAHGGGFLFELYEPKHFVQLTFGLIDVGNKGGDESDETVWPPSFVLAWDMFNLPSLQLVPDLGDNSFQEVVFSHVDFVDKLMLRVQGSGALSYIKGCMQDTALPITFPERPDKCTRRLEAVTK